MLTSMPREPGDIVAAVSAREAEAGQGSALFRQFGLQRDFDIATKTRRDIKKLTAINLLYPEEVILSDDDGFIVGKAILVVSERALKKR